MKKSRQMCPVSKRSFLISFIFTVTAINCLYLPTTNGQPLTWKSVTSHQSIRALTYNSGSLWAVTGGGVFTYEISSGEFTLLTNTEGLSTVNPSSFAFDDSGWLWIGMDDGYLNAIRLSDLTIRHVSIDPEPINIHDMAYHNGSLYLALDFGISLFLIDKEEINSTFRILGGFPANTQVDKLVIFQGELWAATEKGTAVVSLESPNLQDPQFWTNYTQTSGLPHNSVKSFCIAGDSLIIGTENGLTYFDGAGFGQSSLTGNHIRSIAYINGSVYAAGTFNVYRRNNSGTWTGFSPPVSGVRAITADDDGTLWAGHANEGLSRFDEGNAEWIQEPVPGPGGNTFEDMIIDRENRLWASTGLGGNNGVYMYDGSMWEHFTSRNNVPNTTTGIAEGPDGRIFVGSPGAGVTIIDTQPDTLIVTKIDTSNGRLAGSDTPAYVVVQKIKRDSEGNVWILNKYAANGKALVVLTPDDQWYYFSKSDGLTSTVVTQIETDEFNRVWIGTAEEGVDVLDHGGTLDDKTDDVWLHYDESTGLSSDMISGIAAEKGNGVWVATLDGINHIIDGFPVMEVFGSLSNYIVAINVDPAHNKWLGTPNGISILHMDDFTWTHFTTENSDLVDSDIISIYFHGSTGTAYIGTASGLSVITTPYRVAQETAAMISAYPNPFKVNGGATGLTIENLMLNSTVKIFSFSGRLVKNLTPENGGVFGSLAYWDGTDMQGNMVSSGIYFISGGTSNTNSGTIKIAVIR
ncbi:hypothetical protein ACFL6L_01860 [candidate division KSB1 bacterium]